MGGSGEARLVESIEEVTLGTNTGALTAWAGSDGDAGVSDTSLRGDEKKNATVEKQARTQVVQHLVSRRKMN
jgi:hypothetical protein